MFLDHPTRPLKYILSKISRLINNVNLPIRYYFTINKTFHYVMKITREALI